MLSEAALRSALHKIYDTASHMIYITQSMALYYFTLKHLQAQFAYGYKRKEFATRQGRQPAPSFAQSSFQIDSVSGSSLKLCLPLQSEFSVGLLSY